MAQAKPSRTPQVEAAPEPVHAPSVAYQGRRTKTGNSQGFRFEGALFKSHPEFNGKVRGTVIAPGQLLISAEPSEQPENEDDPVLAAFLAFLDKDILDHPENLKPLDAALMNDVAALTKDVIVDLNEDLGPGDFVKWS